MTLTLLPKPSLQEFIQTCTPLARIASLEMDMQHRVDEIANALASYEAIENSVENLSTFLKMDEDFLGIILALLGLSQEKFLRILLAESFAKGDFDTDWKPKKIYSKMRSEAGFAERIAQLLLDGRNSALLMQQISSLYLEQLGLPTDWPEIIHDRTRIQKAILQKLEGEFSNKKGKAVEAIIREYLDAIQQKYGLSHTKGQVQLVGKEIDHAIPSRDDPYVMIMTSYMETTSSSQTARANEQSEVYGTIQKENRRYGTRRVFINFVDGAGWLGRRSDLRKLYDGCDYIINLKTLERLEAIICKFAPEKYFTVQQKPEVEG